MYCANCGNKIIDTASFCPYCGTPVEKPGQTAQAQNQFNPGQTTQAPNQFNAGQTTQAPNQFNAEQTTQAQNQFHAAQAAQAQNQLNYQSAPAQQQIPHAAYQSGPIPGPVPYPAAPAGRKRKKTGVIIAVSAVVAAILIGIVIFAAATLLGGRSEREVLDQYLHSAYFDYDIEEYLDTFPDQVTETLMDIYGYDEDERKQFTTDGQSIFDRDKYYRSVYTISYEIKNISDCSKDILENAQKMYQDLDLDVTEVKQAQVHLQALTDTETNEVELSIFLVKIGNTWYVHPDFTDDNLGIPWDYVE